MQSWHTLAEIHRGNRHELQAALRDCDARYAALPADGDTARADAVDAELAQAAATVQKNLGHAAASVACVASMAEHLRKGGDIIGAEREPRMSEAAKMLRSARMSAVDDGRADAMALELEASAAAGLEFLERITSDLHKLTLTLSVAQRNQRLAWLRRSALANPTADFSDVIRGAERDYASAKLAFSTNKGAA